MRRTYSAIMGLVSPLALPLLAWRTRRQTGEADAWRERLGFIPHLSDNAVIWVHCASIGEINAAAPLINTLVTRHPAHRMLVTSFTGAGRARARELFGAHAVVRYIPYDSAAYVRRFLTRAHPCIGLVIETELWPNLFAGGARTGLPLLLISATVSERSYRRYRRFRSIIAETLRCTSHIAAQSEADAERLKALGARPECISISGNLKFDIAPPADIERRVRRLRRRFFPNSFVWTAGSIREGEETMIVDAVQTLLARAAECTPVLAPRHPERAAAIAELLRKRGLKFYRRTRHRRALEPGEILLLDTLGELMLFYAVANVAFVGGSLIPLGGHNLLEPAAVGCPIIAGPYLDNVAAVAAKLSEAGALSIVHGARQLSAVVEKLLRDELARERASRAARAAVAANRGALDKVLALIEAQLAAKQSSSLRPDPSSSWRR